MRTWMLAFLAGSLSLTFTPCLPSFYCIPLLLILAVACLMTGSRVRLAGVFLLGFLYIFSRAELVLSKDLDRSIEGKTLVVSGVVSSLPEKRRHSIRFEFDINHMIDSKGYGHQSPGKVRLNWYNTPVEVAPGQTWRFSLRLKRPWGFQNPGGFDYESWLFQQRIRATGYVVDDDQNRLINDSRLISIDSYRHLLRQRLADSLSSVDEMPMLVALGLGDRSLIERKDYQTLINTGTSHLLAISGLHIGLVSFLIYIISLPLFKRVGHILNRVPAQYLAATAAIIAATLYALLAGLSVSTQRALVMTLVFWLCLFGTRFYSVSNVFCYAMLAVLLIDPFSLLSPAFWLSFGAVAILLFGMSARILPMSVWWRWGRPQYLVAVGLLPVLMFSFKQYAVTGMLANLVAIPWISFAVVPLVLFGLCLLPVAIIPATCLLKVAAFNISLLWPALELLEGLEYSVWHGPSPSYLQLLIALVGVVIILLPRGLPGRWVGWIWLLPLLSPVHARPAEGVAWFTLLDVGQGLSAVIQTRDHALIYDTGGRFSPTFDAGTAVLVPYLKSRGLHHIDKVILSHGDSDHVGGAPALLKFSKVREILTSEPGRIDIPDITSCRRGDSWQWNGIRFKLLHPGNTMSYKSNNKSCVLMVTVGQKKLLLTGDIEIEAESELLEVYNNQLDAGVMTAPHHGSKTSSSSEFIQAVNPELVLFSVGYRNRFNFPNEDIIRRYNNLGSKILNTARNGAILLELRQNKITVTEYRQQSRRFWHTKM